jgi:hypothetical protein
MTDLPDWMLDTKTPPDVIVKNKPRKPLTDPTLGIPVVLQKEGTPRHRLVSIGDSLTHGFQSGAIFLTQYSFPAIIAREMGWKEMRYPTYNSPDEGLPINLEKLARDIYKKSGSNINWWNLIPTLFFLQKWLDNNEKFWESGEGSHIPTEKEIYHNLATYGWDLRNTISCNADICLQNIEKNKAKDNILRQVVDNHSDRSAVRVLNSARDSNGKALTQPQAAAALSAEGSKENGEGDGIETLIIAIGSNNALGAMLTFKVAWSGDGYDDVDYNDRYTVWRPIHFKAELDLLVAEIHKIRARHVIFATVPHVTIIPMSNGLGTKVAKGSRYFNNYTLPWIQEEDFQPNKHPNLTQQEVRAIDSAIDQYNDYIVDAVREARQQGKDWYVFELCGLLDRLAYRRYINDPEAQPDWWEEVGGEYNLPEPLQQLSPVPNANFFTSDSSGRTNGGLFSLDGMHPTTIGYGIMAQEIIKIMQLAGVKFYESDGVSERPGDVKIDFRRLLQEDTLLSNPPFVVGGILNLIKTIDKNFNLFSNLLRANY